MDVNIVATYAPSGSGNMSKICQNGTLNHKPRWKTSSAIGNVWKLIFKLIFPMQKNQPYFAYDFLIVGKTLCYNGNVSGVD